MKEYILYSLIFLGAFLIPYFILYFLIGAPIYYLELALGQFSSRGPATAFILAKGWQGFSRNVPCFIQNIYSVNIFCIQVLASPWSSIVSFACSTIMSLLAGHCSIWLLHFERTYCGTVAAIGGTMKNALFLGVAMLLIEWMRVYTTVPKNNIQIQHLHALISI